RAGVVGFGSRRSRPLYNPFPLDRRGLGVAPSLLSQVLSDSGAGLNATERVGQAAGRTIGSNEMDDEDVAPGVHDDLVGCLPGEHSPERCLPPRASVPWDLDEARRATVAQAEPSDAPASAHHLDDGLPRDG